MAKYKAIFASVLKFVKKLTITKQPKNVITQGMMPTEPHTGPFILTRTDSADEYQDAASKVFGINELVGLILEQIPLTQDRTQLRRVSKARNTILTDIGCAIHPIDPILAGSPVPCYEVTTNIRLHPGLKTFFFSRNYFEHTKRKYAATFQKPSNSLLLAARRHEFVTSPPITTVVLALRFKGKPKCLCLSQSHAILVVRAGIRIGHLLEIFDQLDATPRPLQVPVAYFFLRSPGSWEVVQMFAPHEQLIPTIVINE
jgi:hypothetical protein